MKTVFKNGTYERLSDEMAEYEVRNKNAQYRSKSEWKKNVRDISKEEEDKEIKTKAKSKKQERNSKLKQKQRK